MKKSFLFAGLTALAFVFTSCNKESEYHRLEITRPAGGALVLYADQTRDSINFLTWDSYKVSIPAIQGNDWISTIDSKDHPVEGNIQNSFYFGWNCRVDLAFTPNTTDSCRMGYVQVDSYEYTATAAYYQVNWHNVLRPYANPIIDKKTGFYTGYKCEMVDSANQDKDKLSFVTYDKWTLTCDNEELVRPELYSGNAGKHEIVLNVAAHNVTPDTLEANFQLKTANGAVTNIRFRQAPKKKPAETDDKK